jgi:hypothetical protein
MKKGESRMKKILVTASWTFFLAVAANSAYGAPLTSTETWITKTMNHIGNLQINGHRTLADWCANRGNAIEFGSFQAAQAVDALGDGLYRCEGEFVNTPEKSQVILFQIDRCDLLVPSDLKKSCP